MGHPRLHKDCGNDRKSTKEVKPLNENIFKLKYQKSVGPRPTFYRNHRAVTVEGTRLS
jgi:hypothetical protein